MAFILVFNLVLSILTVLHSLYVTLQAYRIDRQNLATSCYWLLSVNAFACGSLISRIASGFLPYQTPSLTIIAVAYYVAELLASRHAYRYYRKKEK